MRAPGRGGGGCRDLGLLRSVRQGEGGYLLEAGVFLQVLQGGHRAGLGDRHVRRWAMIYGSEFVVWVVLIGALVFFYLTGGFKR